MSHASDNQVSLSDERLSALVDGELDASEVQRACAQWRDDASVRSRWHAYQLIGDVMRSDELAQPAAHDAQFLAALRARLAQEPVVLAPEPVTAAPADVALARRRLWKGSVAVAAGFVAVVGVVAVTQFGSPLASDATLARGEAAVPTMAAGLQSVSAQASSGLSADEPAAVVLNGRLIRDARLDQYLAAHKKFGGSSAPGAPSGYLRSASVDGTGR